MTSGGREKQGYNSINLTKGGEKMFKKSKFFEYLQKAFDYNGCALEERRIFFMKLNEIKNSFSKNKYRKILINVIGNESMLTGARSWAATEYCRLAQRDIALLRLQFVSDLENLQHRIKNVMILSSLSSATVAISPREPLLYDLSAGPTLSVKDNIPPTS